MAFIISATQKLRQKLEGGWGTIETHGFCFYIYDLWSLNPAFLSNTNQRVKAETLEL